MEKAKLMKLGLSALGGLLMLGANLINDKVKSDELDEKLTKKVAEALENQAKES